MAGTIASASADTTAKIWNVTTGKEIYTLGDNDDAVLNTVFSPDGKYILTTTDHGGVANYGTQLQVTKSGHLAEVHLETELRSHQMAGTLWPTAMRMITPLGFWDTTTGQEVHTLRGHSNWVYSVAFSPDGQYALTGSIDNTAILWDVATGQELHDSRP